MAAMWTATLKGILARKLRLALTTLAVLLGVAFVSGTYVLTDTLQRSFDEIFQRTVTDVDLVVRARDPYTGGGSQRTRIPDAALAQVRAAGGVATADGTAFGYAQFVDHDGQSIQNGLAPTFGLTWPESGAGPLQLVDDGEQRFLPRIGLDGGDGQRRVVDHDRRPPVRRDERLERLARKREANGIPHGRADLGDGLEWRRRPQDRRVLGQVHDHHPRSREDGDLHGIERYSRRKVVRKPRLGQNREASRFVTRQSVPIAR